MTFARTAAISCCSDGRRLSVAPVSHHLKFNEEHANVRRDFGRELIADAHRKGIKVCLVYSFGYDGVNQHALDHPELKAAKKDG
jgi:hypothetical protein